MKDFRGISLMSVAAKVYNRMILSLIYDPTDKILQPYQAGLRNCLEKTVSKRSKSVKQNCLEKIHVLKRVMEAYFQRWLSLIAVFIDFKKVFDSIDK